MKRLNNKGFAITTVVYGLAIMGILLVGIIMSTIATNRTNTRTLVKSIEEELNRFNKSSTNFKPIGNDTQEFTVPENGGGWYRIELWGAQGGNGGGGLGAYTSGVIKLNSGDRLYIYAGKAGTTGNPGESSEVRIRGGDYNSQISKESSIMIAAGGGKSAGASGGTLVGYSSKMTSIGGDIRIDGDFSIDPSSTTTNGTLIGQPKDDYSTDEEKGGVSYISGYAGCDIYNHSEVKYNEETDTWTHTPTNIKYVFKNGHMLPGVNSGDGHAKIEKVMSAEGHANLPRYKSYLNKLSGIRICADGVSKFNIKIVANEEVEEFEITPTNKCGTLTMQKKDVDEIGIWYPGYVGDLKNHIISFYNNDNTTTPTATIGNNNTSSPNYIGVFETATPTGIHISAYEYNSTTFLPDKGTYYIQPITSENKVVTAKQDATLDNNGIQIDYLQGNARQKWTIEVIDRANNEFKIIELSRYKALEILQDENKLGNLISANTSFNNYARNEPQIWKIESMGDGTYTISTVMSKYNQSQDTGNIIPQTSSTNTDHKDYLIIGINNKKTARFKLIPLDYN